MTKKPLIFLLILSSIFLFSCVNNSKTKAVRAINPSGDSHVYFNRSYKSCWQKTHQYLQSKKATFIYSSFSEGMIKAKLEDKTTLWCYFTPTTAKATHLELRLWQRGQKSSNEKQRAFYFNELSSRLK